jgi:hypothetical protein
LALPCGSTPPNWAGAYLEATRPETGGKAHFTDKLPFNYLNAGLIGRALPKAHLIAMVREPLDSCYAMYKTLFASGHHFTYDLQELARYYAGWHRLMRHWQAVFGERLLIVSYEDMRQRGSRNGTRADPPVSPRSLPAALGGSLSSLL